MSEEEDLQGDQRQERVSRRAFLKYSGTIILVMGSGYFAPADGRPGTPGNVPYPTPNFQVFGAGIIELKERTSNIRGIQC